MKSFQNYISCNSSSIKKWRKLFTKRAKQRNTVRKNKNHVEQSYYLEKSGPSIEVQIYSLGYFDFENLEE